MRAVELERAGREGVAGLGVEVGGHQRAQRRRGDASFPLEGEHAERCSRQLEARVIAAARDLDAVPPRDPGDAPVAERVGPQQIPGGERRDLDERNRARPVRARLLEAHRHAQLGEGVVGLKHVSARQPARDARGCAAARLRGREPATFRPVLGRQRSAPVFGVGSFAAQRAREGHAPLGRECEAPRQRFDGAQADLADGEPELRVQEAPARVRADPRARTHDEHRRLDRRLGLGAPRGREGANRLQASELQRVERVTGSARIRGRLERRVPLDACEGMQRALVRAERALGERVVPGVTARHRRETIRRCLVLGPLQQLRCGAQRDVPVLVIRDRRRKRHQVRVIRRRSVSAQEPRRDRDDREPDSECNAPERCVHLTHTLKGILVANRTGPAALVNSRSSS
jgi:hypothetical protein